MDKKKFYRSKNDKVIAGIAGGLSEYFNIDSLLIRILFIASLFVGGAGLIIYLVIWIASPKIDSPENNDENESDENSDEAKRNIISYSKQTSLGRFIAGILFVVIGVTIFLKEFFDFITPRTVVAMTLLCIGIFILFQQFKKN